MRAFLKSYRVHNADMGNLRQRDEDEDREEENTSSRIGKVCLGVRNVWEGSGAVVACSFPITHFEGVANPPQGRCG